MLEKHVRVRRTAVARDVDQGKGDGCDGHCARDRYERGTPLGPQLTLTRLRAVPWTERVFVDGKGCWLTSDGGERFLDMAAGIGVVNVGHCHPHVVAAIQAQAAKIIHAQTSIMHHQPMLTLVERLEKITPPGLDCFFFPGASGAEAVEASLKLVRQATGKQNIIVMQGGYHGRTLATSSMTTSKTIYRVGAGPHMSSVFVTPFPYRTQMGVGDHVTQDEMEDICLGQLELLLRQQTAASDTAALFIEPVLGEGGYVPASGRFLQGISDICRRNEILVVADEIQCGFGRTGSMFYSSSVGFEPDVMLMAKGLASGMPLSCVAASKALFDKQPVGSMGGTYAGNAVACAAANATLDVFEQEPIVANAGARGKQLQAGLAEIAQTLGRGHVVRGAGLMVAYELKGAPRGTAAAISALCCDTHHMLVLTCSDYETMRFVPPLVISADEIDLALDRFRQALEHVLSH